MLRSRPSVLMMPVPAPKKLLFLQHFLLLLLLLLHAASTRRSAAATTTPTATSLQLSRLNSIEQRKKMRSLPRISEAERLGPEMEGMQ